MLQKCYKCHTFATNAPPLNIFATLCYNDATTIYRLNTLIFNDAQFATNATYLFFVPIFREKISSPLRTKKGRPVSRQNDPAVLMKT